MAHSVESKSWAGSPVDRLKQFLKRVARRLLGRPPAALAVATHPFDQNHGVDTSGLLERDRLRTGHVNDTHNTAYFGVPPSRFKNAMERWRATPGTAPTEEYRFVDVGCGKGRAVLLASQMPFREVVGVELHPQLAETARLNLDRWREGAGTAARTSIVCADARPPYLTCLVGALCCMFITPSGRLSFVKCCWP